VPILRYSYAFHTASILYKSAAETYVGGTVSAVVFTK
jgi:hypothetical protein